MMTSVKVILIAVSAVVLHAVLSASQLTSVGESRFDNSVASDPLDKDDWTLFKSSSDERSWDHDDGSGEMTSDEGAVDGGMLPSTDNSEANSDATSSQPRPAQMVPFTSVVVPRQSNSLRMSHLNHCHHFMWEVSRVWVVKSNVSLH